MLRPAILMILASAGTCLAEPLNLPLSLDFEPVVLKSKIAAGQKLETAMDVVSNLKIEINGQEIDQKTNMLIRMKTVVSAIDGSPNILATCTYTRMRMQLNVMGQEMGYDTDDKASLEGNAMAAGAHIVGKPIKMEISPDMEVMKVEGLEQMEKGGQGLGLESVFGNDIARFFPKQEVKTGDTFPFETIKPDAGMGEMIVEGEYKVAGMADLDGKKVVVLEMAGVIKVAPEGDQPVQLELKGGETKGRLYWDLENGIMIRQENKMTMTVSKDGMVLPVVTDVEISSKLKE